MLSSHQYALLEPMFHLQLEKENLKILRLDNEVRLFTSVRILRSIFCFIIYINHGISSYYTSVCNCSIVHTYFPMVIFHKQMFLIIL